MTLPIPETPVDGWTTDDLDAMPETHVRYELTDGALTVSPSPTDLHQHIAAALMLHLEAEAPDGMSATQAVEIRFNRSLTRIPDVLVVRRDDTPRHWFAPHEVVVAVEIESPGSHVDDRATKPAIYAQHRIPHYWRFEVKPLTVITYQLAGDGAYAETGRSAERLTTETPYPVDIALTGLLPRWAR